MKPVNNNMQSAFKNIKYADSSDGKYLKPKFINKNICSTTLKNKLHYLTKKFKISRDEELKNIHEFRINKLNEVNNNLTTIISQIKNTTLKSNESLKITINNPETLNNEIIDLLTDISTKSYDGIDFIDKKKLKKIQENDFIVVMENIISQLDEPKDIKYIYNLLDIITNTKKLNIKSANKIKIILDNKLKHTTINFINQKHDEKRPKETILKLHAFLSLCKENNIHLSKSEKKSISKLCMELFSKYCHLITPNKQDLNIVKQQFKEFEHIKYDIVIPIIKHTAYNVEKNIIYMNKNLVANANILKTIIETPERKLSFSRETKSSLYNKFTEFSDSLGESQKLYNKSQEAILKNKNKKQAQKKHKISLEKLNKLATNYASQYNTYKHQQNSLNEYVEQYEKTSLSTDINSIKQYLNSTELAENVETYILEKAENIDIDRNTDNLNLLTLVKEKIIDLNKKHNKLTVLLIINSSLDIAKQVSESNLSIAKNFSTQLNNTINFMDANQSNKKYFDQLTDKNESLDDFNPLTIDSYQNIDPPPQNNLFVIDNADVGNDFYFGKGNKTFSSFSSENNTKYPGTEKNSSFKTNAKQVDPVLNIPNSSNTVIEEKKIIAKDDNANIIANENSNSRSNLLKDLIDPDNIKKLKPLKNKQPDENKTSETPRSMFDAVRTQINKNKGIIDEQRKASELNKGLNNETKDAEWE